MKRILLVVLILLGSPLSAQSDKPRYASDLCEVDSEACRKLAVEISKLDLADMLDRQQQSNNSADLMCPENNPDCCIGINNDNCAAVNKSLIKAARKELESAVLFRGNGCPFSQEICDFFPSGTFCEDDQEYSYLVGCYDQPVFSDWEPPKKICPCGQEIRENAQACLPKRCYRRGVPVPCVSACDIPVAVLVPGISTPADSALPQLLDQLQRKEVQIEAAKVLYDELSGKLKVVKAEILSLSN